MKKYTQILVLLLLPMALFAGFDWGNSGGTCSGSGSFTQPIVEGDTIDVGTIIAGKTGVEVKLNSDEDVDIQIWDGSKPIVGWNIEAPIGDYPHDFLDTVYNNMKIEYSGYNGDGTGYGHEFIKINATNKNLQVKAFGYKAGTAKVEYSWTGTVGCAEDNTFTNYGDGSFTQYVGNKVWSDIDGTIKKGVKDVTICLISEENFWGSSTDIDIQLVDLESNTKIVAWPSGILNGPNKSSTNYKGATITWTGYNGLEGTSRTGRHKGRECIRIDGEVPSELKMKAYGYNPGEYLVHYNWGYPIEIGENGLIFSKERSKFKDWATETFTQSMVMITTASMLPSELWYAFFTDVTNQTTPGSFTAASQVIFSFFDVDDLYDIQRATIIYRKNNEIQARKFAPNNNTLKYSVSNIDKEEVAISVLANIHPDAVGNIIYAELIDRGSGALLETYDLIKVKNSYAWNAMMFFPLVGFDLSKFSTKEFLINVKWKNIGVHQGETIPIYINTN